jgi:hypothetical protein
MEAARLDSGRVPGAARYGSFAYVKASDESSPGRAPAVGCLGHSGGIEAAHRPGSGRAAISGE